MDFPMEGDCIEAAQTAIAILGMALIVFGGIVALQYWRDYRIRRRKRFRLK